MSHWSSDGACGYLHALPDGTYSRFDPYLLPEARGRSSWQGSPFDNVSVGRVDENG